MESIPFSSSCLVLDHCYFPLRSLNKVKVNSPLQWTSRIPQTQAESLKINIDMLFSPCVCVCVSAYMCVFHRLLLAHLQWLSHPHSQPLRVTNGPSSPLCLTPGGYFFILCQPDWSNTSLTSPANEVADAGSFLSSPLCLFACFSVSIRGSSFPIQC